MKVRRAMFDEMAFLAELKRTTRARCLPYVREAQTREEYVAFFREQVFATNEVLVAEGGSLGIVGFCASRPGWIDHLFVDPAYQRRGIGSLLLRSVLATQTSVQLWVFQRNAGAIALYRSHGFRLVRETAGTANEECEPDALFVWSSLSKA